jgi:hypothetical protein
MAKGCRFEYLRKEHWLPAVVSDVNNSLVSDNASVETAESAETKKRLARVGSAAVSMNWREIGSTFVVPYDVHEPLDMGSPEAVIEPMCIVPRNIRDPHTNLQALKGPGSRFYYLLSQHFEVLSSSPTSLSSSSRNLCESVVDALG